MWLRSIYATTGRRKKAYRKAQKKEQKLFDTLETLFPALDSEECCTNAENASNIKDAICCYLQYNEYDPEKFGMK